MKIFSGATTKYPHFRKIQVKHKNYNYILLLPRHNHEWICYADEKKGIIKLMAGKRKTTYKTFTHIPKVILEQLDFRIDKEKGVYNLFRYMPNRKTVYVFQKKGLLGEL